MILVLLVAVSVVAVPVDPVLTNVAVRVCFTAFMRVLSVSRRYRLKQDHILLPVYMC
jgi:hypothetical protein